MSSGYTVAQNTNKWYADDLYYTSGEKEINVIQIEFNEYTEEEPGYEQDTYEDDTNVYLDMSYSSRINRFHRDYYGSSISFHYGFFHDPFISTHCHLGSYYYDPFYHSHWGWYHDPFYSWHYPYYGYSHYYSSYYNYWNYPYYTPLNNQATNITYGPREGLNTTTSMGSASRPNRPVTNSINNPSLYKRNISQANTNYDYTSSKLKDSSAPAKTNRLKLNKPSTHQVNKLITNPIQQKKTNYQSNSKPRANYNTSKPKNNFNTPRPSNKTSNKLSNTRNTRPVRSNSSSGRKPR